MLETTRRPFPTAGVLALAAGLLLAGPARVRADDIVEETKKLNEVLAQELNAKATEALLDALRASKTDPVKAGEVLRSFRPQIADSKALTEERRKELLRAFDDRIRTYEERAKLLGRQRNDDNDRQAAARDRRSQFEEQERRNDQLRDMHLQIAELRRQGRLAEAYDKHQEMTGKFGRTPSGISGQRPTRIADNLATMRRIQNERDRRYIKAMEEVVRSSMPVIGDIEFPPREKWLALTKRRSQIKLTEEEKQLLKALNTPITATFKDQPLERAIEYFEKTVGLRMTLDSAALQAAAINMETPVSLDAKGVTTRTALKKVLGGAGLTFVIRDATAVVTTPERASQMLVKRSYYVGDLVGLFDLRFDPVFNQLQMAQTVAALIDFIQSVEPGSWRSGGGPGSIGFVPASLSLVVNQTAEMHFVLMGALRP